jgi:hypothetical protein
LLLIPDKQYRIDDDRIGNKLGFVNDDENDDDDDVAVNSLALDDTFVMIRFINMALFVVVDDDGKVEVDNECGLIHRLLLPVFPVVVVVVAVMVPLSSSSSSSLSTPS